MPGAKMGPLLFQDFLAVELIYLIRNICVLSDGFDFEPCSTYFMYSIEALKRKLTTEYIDFDSVIGALRTHN